MVDIKDRLVGGFVQNFVYVPAQLREDSHLQVFIFKEESTVGPVNFGVTQSILHGIGVDGAVIRGKEDGVLVIGTPYIRWENDLSLRDLDSGAGPFERPNDQQKQD
jgi:hypothetical protein